MVAVHVPESSPLAEHRAGTAAADRAGLALPPPMTNRGGVTENTQTRIEQIGSLLGIGVDWLTFTAGPELAADLVAETRLDEKGEGGAVGFQRRERRECLGGVCTRKWEPTQASRAYGDRYESWEWSGGNGRPWAVGRLLGHPGGHPTRVDVAFDLEVAPDFSPERLLERCEAERLARFKLGVSGEDGINSRYIGGKTADVRVCIYRKDLEQAAFGWEHGPVLRVECRMKGDHAQRVGVVAGGGLEGVYEAAAGLIFERTGLQLLPAMRPLPELPDFFPEAEAAQEVFQFLRQHGSMVVALGDAGLLRGAFHLAKEDSGRCRMRSSRADRRERRYAQFNRDAFLRAVDSMLRGTKAREEAEPWTS